MLSNLVNSFKNTINNGLQRDQTLALPNSYKIPSTYDMYDQEKEVDEWEQFDSHKYLNVNIVKEYTMNWSHLPLPPPDVDPNYPRFKFNSYTFGSIKTHHGPEIIDELIEELSDKGFSKALQWSETLENSSMIRLQQFERQLLDKIKIENIQKSNPLIKILEGQDIYECQKPAEMLQTKSKAGFEIILMLLMDDEFPDRRNRRALLDKTLKFIGMGRITHSQYDYINSMFICSSLQNHETMLDEIHQTLNFADITTLANDKDYQKVTSFVNKNKADTFVNNSNTRYKQKVEDPVYRNDQISYTPIKQGLTIQQQNDVQLNQTQMFSNPSSLFVIKKRTNLNQVSNRDDSGLTQYKLEQVFEEKVLNDNILKSIDNLKFTNSVGIKNKETLYEQGKTTIDDENYDFNEREQNY
ncbi:UNKNOWN [Stylonychia lemnae]|uniref:Uncharacterized protein n=1 Tax=Stylonychia lemnae TaxID=5949 RepID=A0A078AWT5_STYLE|nr:UNKNOWN [Stylonychia lemnae]|eukprot:CDW86629.1 UNKNOWN [Stylonychia lemnae]